MQLVVPEILADARGLSMPLPIAGVLVALALWVFGWCSYRFWVVLLATLVAGIFGLYEAPLWQVQPLAAALLLALAAGLLSLALVQFAAFVVGGALALGLAQAILPTWEQPLLFFLGGGVLGLFLFRLLVMIFTSLGGAALLAHSLLILLDRFAVLDSVGYSQERGLFLNWLVGGAAVLGFVIQLILSRRGKPEGKDSKKAKHGEAKKDREKKDDHKDRDKGSSWKWLEPFRKAA